MHEEFGIYPYHCYVPFQILSLKQMQYSTCR